MVVKKYMILYKFSVYQIACRPEDIVEGEDHLNLIRCWCKLFQKVAEMLKLKYVSMNQKALHANTYPNMRQHIEAIRSDIIYPNGLQVGQKILSSNHQGSPYRYNDKYLDSMVIVTNILQAHIFHHNYLQST